MYKMIFEDEVKKELVKTEIKLITLCFNISDTAGEMAIKSALDNFYNYLCKGLGVERIIPSMNMEYRKYVIDLTSAFPDNLLPKAMPIILGIRKK